mmetsp:Transcript_24147/g.56962  ORF Transcript_24147/g.56962 Transcript_24147/m.56962 type:complete len:276 (-) Transcript_24147:2449-3276(-)
MTNWNKIVFEYACPTIGIFISTALYSAPVKSLAVALERKSLGALNPTPWGILMGNCLGWLAYAYYSGDPFVLASNVPGMLVSVWLNTGASKLQYYAEVKPISESNSVENNVRKGLVFTPQDKLVLGVLGSWISALVVVGWFKIAKGYEKEIVGILVNINLLFFYGAPLQTIKTVIQEKCSDSIHTPTMVLNCINAGFWGAYGIAINNIVIYGPNGIGFFLGCIQAVLCCTFPKSTPPVDVDDTPLLDGTEDTIMDNSSEPEMEEDMPVPPVSELL